MPTEIGKYQAWTESFSLSDDGPAAFAALNKLSEIEFILTMREENFVEQIERVVAR